MLAACCPLGSRQSGAATPAPLCHRWGTPPRLPGRRDRDRLDLDKLARIAKDGHPEQRAWRVMIAEESGGSTAWGRGRRQRARSGAEELGPEQLQVIVAEAVTGQPLGGPAVAGIDLLQEGGHRLRPRALQLVGLAADVVCVRR